MSRFAFGFLTSLLLATSAFAQAIPAEGTHILRGLLKYHGFQPIENLEQVPQEGVLVVIVGDLRRRPGWLGGVPQLLAKKSGVLVISDGPLDLGQLFPLAEQARGQGCSVFPNTVNATRPETCFGGDFTMPYARIAVPPVPDLLILAQMKQIATRNPSTIITVGNDPYLGVELAKFPVGSRHRGGIRVPDGSLLAAMSDPDKPGTMMAFANRAMFTNELMVAKDPNAQAAMLPGPQNFYLGYFVGAYLKSRIVPAKRGETRKVLFVEDGKIITDFDSVTFVEQPGMPGVPPIMPPIPKLIDFAVDKGNQIVGQLEDKDIPHALLKNNEIRARANYLMTGAIVATVVFCLYFLARGWRALRPTDMIPRPKILIEGDGGMISQRRLGLIECGNLYEPTRDHARLLFKGWGVPPDATALPHLNVDRPSRPIRRLAADLRELWDIAHGSTRRQITLDDLEELEEMIQDLTAAHQAGIWRFASEGEIPETAKKVTRTGLPQAVPPGGDR